MWTRSAGSWPNFIAAIALLMLGASCGFDDQEPRQSDLVTVAVSQDISFFQAKFSPDGARIAFSGINDLGRSVLGVVREGEAEVIWDQDWVFDFAWMPDSNELLTSAGPAQGPSRLMVIDVTGAVVEVIESSRDLVVVDGMEVAPHGRTAIVSARPTGPTDEPADLFELSLSSGDMTPLTRTPRRSERFPALLASGALAFETGRYDDRPNAAIGVLRSDGDRDQITPGSQVASEPAAVPGTDVIVFGTFGSEDVGRNELWAADINGDWREMLFPFEGRFADPDPDGESILYVEVVPPGGPYKIMSRPLDLPIR